MEENLPAANIIIEIRVCEFLPNLSGKAGDHSLPPTAGDHSPLSRLRHRRSRDHSFFAPTSPETAYLILNSIRVNIVVAADFVLDRRSPEAVLPQI